MNNFDLYCAINNIDEDLVIEANTTQHHLNKKYAWSAAVAVFAILIAISVFGHFHKTPDIATTNLSKSTTTDTSVPSTPPDSNDNQQNEIGNSTTNPAYYVAPSWDNKPITNKVQSLVFNDTEYVTLNSVKSIPITQDTEKKLDEQVIPVIDNETGKEYFISAGVYSIKNISSACIIALKFDDYDGFYPFINSSFSISTLEDLISAIDLKSTLTFGDIEYKEVDNLQTSTKNYVPNNQSDIWEYLLFDSKMEDLGDIDIVPLFDISLNAPSLGIFNKALVVSDDGYIQTNILEVNHTFYIGKEAVENFKKYVFSLSSNTVPYISGEEVTTPACITF